MRLVNMDVDRYGTSDRCRLGPFSPGLNVLCGPQGSGKTTLLNWLRTIAAESYGRFYDRPDPAWNRTRSPMSGMVRIENRGYQSTISTDRNGRVSFDGSDSNANTSWTPQQRQAFAGLAAATSSADTESSLQKLADDLGLTQSTDAYASREHLLARERELVAQLKNSENLSARQSRLLARQHELEAELRSVGRGPLRYDGMATEHRRLDARYAAIEADLQHTLDEIERLDRQLAEKQTELSNVRSGTAVKIDDSYRQQLHKLDQRLNQWRQTLRDIKAHRESLEYNATDARLDKQLGDQLSSTKEADPRAAMRALEAQILHTRQQLDGLVDRYSRVPGYDYRTASAAVGGHEVNGHQGIYRDASGRTYVGAPEHLPEASQLPETLRAMQKDLHEVCQQLARHEATAATETLKQQSQQLQRCESELLQSVERLIEERAALLRRIANEHHLSIDQLTLAFGSWCQCYDHPHLQDWLLSEEGGRTTNSPGVDADLEQRLLSEINSLQQEHKHASLRADDCRRQIQDADSHRRGTWQRRPAASRYSEADVAAQLERVHADLNAISHRDSLERELSDVRLQLGRPSTENNFRQRVNHHIRGMMPASGYEYVREDGPEVRYDLVDGIVTDFQDSAYRLRTRREVPSAIVRIAMRLAIADLMREKGEPICLIVDQTLDSLSVELQQAAMAHVAAVAGRDQQVVLMSADQRVADLARSQGGWVGYMQSARQAGADLDVNRHLTALANDHEADKWYQPSIAKPRQSEKPQREYYLTERSLVEDLPSIDPNTAACCRALGIDRIEDLLDVDPYWLADSLRLEGKGHARVVAWQAEASLLCSVRNLRPFDAKVLVGAGVRTPSQLSEMHPSHLLERVERFLTTDRGRRILSSGSSYELSRITSWIASAKGGSRRFSRSSDFDRDNQRSYQRSPNRNGYSSRSSERNTRSNRSYSSREYDREYRRSDRDYDYERDNERSGRGTSRSSSRSSRSNSRRSSRSEYPVVHRNGQRRHSGRDYQEANESTRSSGSESVRLSSATSRSESSTEDRLRFYLELSSPVVDAPSIGPRMAAKLESLDIYTVDQLLAADADHVADKLNHRRVDAEIVRAWQEQARLVCRIPNLRGHDAQLLVACEITSPEELSRMDPGTVLAQVSEVVATKEGQRILRGSKEPDLEEVTDWISWAASCRTLSAA